MENKWNNDFENILENIRINCVIMHKHHKSQYISYKDYLKYFRIPTIFLSAFNIFASVGLQPYVQQEFISLLTSGVSLVTGIINSIELYLNINKSMENSLDISKEFYILSIDIFKMLALNRLNRAVDGKTYLEDKYHIYCNIIERCNIIDKKINDQLSFIPLTPIHHTINQTVSPYNSNNVPQPYLHHIQQQISNDDDDSSTDEENKT